MRKLFRNILIIATIIILLTSLFSISSRKVYGFWNPFKIPTKVRVYDRTYKMSPYAKPVVLKDEKIPKYKASGSLLDILTGKKFYMNHPKGEFVPTVIYMQTKDDKYYVLSLSGGP